MTLIQHASRLLAWLSLAATLSLSSTLVSAQVAACPMTPPGQITLVNTGLPVVELWTNANAPILDREN